MKISWKWLKRWVDAGAADPAELGDQLTMAGLELEGIERLGEGGDGIVVARITEIAPHPNADRLVVCQVDAGEGQPRQIVCGAKNMVAGDLVPCALPGSQPPAFDFEIGERKMRGVLSQGMLCAGEELGIEDDADGLLILPEGMGDRVGEPIFDALGVKDVVLELSLTPNRPDGLSHMGVAREVAAIRGLTLKAEALEASAPEGVARTDAVALSIDDAEGCSRYALAIIEGVQVGPSPAWLSRALEAIGVRSINNVVDVTNFVMMDIGQPLHAFDLDQLQGPAIRVRRAVDGETMQGIDHRDYALTSEDLVIADAARPVAIAGVMGGAATEVTEATTRVLLECACFQTTTVRKSAKRHGLHTESSHRFERGVDPGATIDNLWHAAHTLLRALGPEARITGWAEAGQGAPEATIVELPGELCARFTGMPITDAQIEQTLGSIGFGVERVADGWRVTVPSWRPDVERPVDLIEEVARLVGFDNLPATMPARSMGHEHTQRASDDAHPPTIVPPAQLAARRHAEDLLLGVGLHQVVNYSFMSHEELDALGLPEDDARRQVVTVANPMTRDQALMRTTLIPGLLRNLKTNLAQRRHDLALFEVGRRYLPGHEAHTLAILLTGKSLDHWSGRREWDLYDLKGMVEAFGRGADLSGARWRVPETLEAYLHPGVQAQWIDADGAVLATIGRVHPAIAQREGWPAVFVAEVDLGLLLTSPAWTPAYTAPSRFPESARDYAFVLDAAHPYAAVEAAIDALRASDARFGALAERVELFDVYQGAQLEPGKRSLALNVIYRAEDHTLTDEEVQQATEALTAHLASTLGATLR